MLTKIRISGWKSIREMAEPLALGPLNVMVGANGSGKSNLLSFFEFLEAMAAGGPRQDKARLWHYVASAGGANTLLHLGVKQTREIKVTLGFAIASNCIEYEQSFQFVAPDNLFFDSSVFSTTGTVEYLSTDRSPLADTVLGSLERIRVFHFHDTSITAPARLNCYIQDNRRLARDAGNLAAMLYLYKMKHPIAYRRITSAVRLLAPAFGDFDLEPGELNTSRILLNWRGPKGDHLFGPHQLSDGTLRGIALCTLLLQPQADLPELIVLDEPELGLHPSAIAIVAGLLKQVSLRCQVLVATQSVTLLDHFDYGDVIVVDGRDGTSSYTRLDPADFEAWREDYSIGNLWERNVIGGGPF